MRYAIRSQIIFRYFDFLTPIYLTRIFSLYPSFPVQPLLLLYHVWHIYTLWKYCAQLLEKTASASETVTPNRHSHYQGHVFSRTPQWRWSEFRFCSVSSSNHTHGIQDTNIVSGRLISLLPNILFLRAVSARTNRKLFLLLVDFTSSVSTISSAPNTAQWNLNLTHSSPEKKNLTHTHCNWNSLKKKNRTI